MRPSDAELRQVRRNQILAIAILVVLVLSGVGWAVWAWRSSRPPNERLVDVPIDGANFNAARRAQAQASPRTLVQRNPPAPPADGVRRLGTSWRARAGEAVMVVSQTKQGEWRISYSYDPPRSTPQQQGLILARFNSINLNLTPEQVKQLDDLGPFSAGMTIGDADKQQLEKLWKDYIAAGGDGARAAAAEKALVATLRDVGTRSDPATRAALQQRADKIKSILTPEQIAKLPH